MVAGRHVPQRAPGAPGEQQSRNGVPAPAVPDAPGHGAIRGQTRHRCPGNEGANLHVSPN